MLAASPSSSNVPPDNLQPAPIGAFTSIPRQQLAKDRSALVTQAYPADLSEKNATGFALGRSPLPIHSEGRDFTLRVEAQPPAFSPATANSAVFDDRCHDPYRAGGQTNPKVNWQLQDNDNTDHAEQDA